MGFGFRLIARYIVSAIVPYMFLAQLLLTSVLFAQQSSRLTEMLLIARLPNYFLLEFSAALLPNIVAFTLPMATLAGVLVGFSRLTSDSELVAMRAAGVGTWRLVQSVVLTGVLLSVVALGLNLWVAPQSARTLRRVALNAALYKLDSPVEPRSFNTEIRGHVLYVRDGDKAQGQWGRVFLYIQEKDGSTRLVTARSGRIDSAGEKSELVLYDVVVTTLPASDKEKAGTPFVTEKLAQSRLTFDIGRKGLIEQLRLNETEPEEMQWQELVHLTTTDSGAQGRHAATILHRRLTLSAGPLIFALLGAGLGLRLRRGGRGLGMLLSLAALILHYLVTLLGEAWARAGIVDPGLGIWLANILAGICALLLLWTTRKPLFGHLKILRWGGIPAASLTAQDPPVATAARNPSRGISMMRWVSFPTLLDKSLLQSLAVSFAFALFALTAIFLIFTLFELWRFIVEKGTPARLVVQYLLFLLPFASVQLTPPSMLVAALATYALISRRSEVVAWLASGQSVYRLALPGLFFALGVGICLWAVQEGLVPSTNEKQNALRAQIRGRVSRATTETGGFWLASTETGRLYSYELEEEGVLKEPTIYEFDGEGVHLSRVLKGRMGSRLGPTSLRLSEVLQLEFGGTQLAEERQEQIVVERVEPEDVFKIYTNKPSQLSAKALSAYIKTVKKRGGSIASLMVALQRKYAEPFGVFVMTLIGIPLALMYGRRSTVTALAVAVVIGLAFWGATSGFEQLGRYGFLPPTVAAWAPFVVFAAAGTYLLMKART
jgi:LPS export ABC transporter permease LptG/LPS export ABC transporter permease LptF